MMVHPNRVLFFAMLLMTFYSVTAQEYKKFRAGFGLSYLQQGIDWGAAASFEVSYRIKDNILVGYRGESAATPSNSNTISSRSLNSQYYFAGYRSFRPFVGIGAGVFRPGNSMSGGCGGPNMDHTWNVETKFGVYPRIGFDLRHLSITLDWNIAGSSKSTMGNGLSPSEHGYDPPHTVYLKNNYLSLKIGFFIGGGKKKMKRIKENELK